MKLLLKCLSWFWRAFQRDSFPLRTKSHHRCLSGVRNFVMRQFLLRSAITKFFLKFEHFFLVLKAEIINFNKFFFYLNFFLYHGILVDAPVNRLGNTVFVRVNIILLWILRSPNNLVRLLNHLLKLYFLFLWYRWQKLIMNMLHVHFLFWLEALLLSLLVMLLPFLSFKLINWL